MIRPRKAAGPIAAVAAWVTLTIPVLATAGEGPPALVLSKGDRIILVGKREVHRCEMRQT